MASLLCYPLDYPDVPTAIAGAKRVGPHVDVLKVGLELFVEGGPSVVRSIAELGKPIFLDLKLHDIPETVQRAVARACDLGARYLTVHAGGGPRMLAAAQEAVVRSGSALTLLGVTVLTSIDAAELTDLGIARSPAEHALHLARLGHAAGLRGFVCSPQEVAHLRQTLGPDVVLVTPGVRPAGAEAGDQRRVATPAAAVQAGSSMLVVGRPIRDAKEPNLAAQAIRAEMFSATSEQLGQRLS
jgi:orotidine-5'-phosphate decarboxylase